MCSRINISLYYSTILLAVSFVFVGCQKDQHNDSSKVTATDPTGHPTGPPSPISQVPVGQGTSDGGGGNGIKNKVFEAYIVNPVKLDAFKVHLIHIFKHINDLILKEVSDE